MLNQLFVKFPMSKILINLFKKKTDKLLYKYARVLEELLLKTIVVTPCNWKSSIMRFDTSNTLRFTVSEVNRSSRNIEIREKNKSSLHITRMPTKCSRATSPGPKLFNKTTIYRKNF